MYLRYQADPNSVDPSWREVLRDYVPTQKQRRLSGRDTGSGGRLPAPAPQPAAAPASRRRHPRHPAGQTGTRAEPLAGLPATKAASGIGVTNRDGSGGTQPTPEPAPPATTETSKVLRGASAAVVRNMSASLAVPTATSVRAVPVKAMIDNRIVVNNHLARTRGGRCPSRTCWATRSSRRSSRSPT